MISDRELTLKTFRYVRVIIVAMSIGLLVSVFVETQRSECILGSFSAYYYTPARGLFTGGLIAIGVCLIALRGSDDLSDNLLNAAGLFAPMVALVPMELQTLEQLPGATEFTRTRQAACIDGEFRTGGPQAGGFRLTTDGRADSVFNNFTSLIVLVAAGLILLAVLIAYSRRHPAVGVFTPGWLPWLISVSVVTGLFVLYHAGDRGRDFFLANVHYLSAGLLFGLIALYALREGWKMRGEKIGRKRGYAYIALGALIPIGCFLIFCIGKISDWDYTTLGVELWGIILFLAFWIIQTADLWNHPTSGDAIVARRATAGLQETP